MTDLCWVDIETTGLDPQYDDILEIAAVRTTETGERVGEYHSLVWPRDIITPRGSDKVVYGMHRYDSVRWELEGVSLRVALRELLIIAQGCVVGGHNVEFDLRFLKAAGVRCDLHCFSDLLKAGVDTMGMATKLKRSGRIDSKSLEELCNFCGVSNEGAHTAKADIERTIACWMTLTGGKVVR